MKRCAVTKPYSPTSLAQVINSNSDVKVNVGSIVNSNPGVLPIIPKLVADPRSTPAKSDDRLQLNKSMLENIAMQQETNRNNNRNIMKLFPDIELGIQILVSSILSPKKMTDVQLIYRLKKNFKFPPAVASTVLSTVQNYMAEDWQLENKLPDIVREALATAGSYSLAVIPESSVDELINQDIITSISTESYRDKIDSLVELVTAPVHLLTPNNTSPFDKNIVPTKPKPLDLIKHLASEEYVSITDNLNFTKFSDAKDRIKSKLIRSSYRRGRGNGTLTAESLRERVEYLDIFRKRGKINTASNVAFMRQKDETARRSVGKPMVVKFPSSSVIPVTVPGNPTEHAGYLILLDGDGKPVNMDVTNQKEGNVRSNMFGDSNSAALTPVQIAYKNLVADTDAKVDSIQLFDMYKDIIERQIFQSIKNSIYGNNVEISNKNDIYYTMFMRALSEQRTSILFIPKEMLVYFHYNLNDYGIGKSVLDNLSILTSLRAILLFARVMSQAKAAIDVTDVSVTFDPRDPDPDKTISIIQDSALKLRQNFFPLGINNPLDLVHWVQRAGLKFSYSNHPMLPETKVEFTSQKLEHVVPDSDLEETLRKQTFQTLAIPPELVDSAFSPEFAVSAVNNNLMLSKRVMVYQQALSRDLTKLIKAHVYNDDELRKRLMEDILKNKDTVMTTLGEDFKHLKTLSEDEFVDALLDALSDNIEVELPKPENTNLTNMSTEFEEYKKGLTNVFDFLLNKDTFAEDIAGDVQNHIDTLKNIYITQLLREWCANNNYYPEAVSMITASEEDINKTVEIITQQLTSTMRNGVLLLRTMQEIKKALSSDLQMVTGEGGESPPAEPSDNSGDSSTEPKDDGFSDDMLKM